MSTNLEHWKSAVASSTLRPRCPHWAPKAIRGCIAQWHFQLLFLCCFKPGPRSSALKYARSQTWFSFCFTPQPITSLVLTATHGDCQTGRAATASSQGEKSWDCTLKLFNDQCNWTMEWIPINVTMETLQQVFCNGFISAPAGKNALSSQQST